MKNHRLNLTKGLLVTVGSLLLAAFAFAGYFLLFMALERYFYRESTYGFVSWARLGYGLFWLVLAYLIYQTDLREWGKAVFLAAGLTTFLAAINVQYYENPWLGIVLSVLVVGGAVYLLARKKKEWFHYYAIAIAIALALFYL